MAYGGAQEYYGVTPDLCTLGKACGGGYPLAAIAGREEIMSLFDAGRVGEEQFLFQIGTLSGNPIAAVAGLATLELLREPGTYERVNAMGNRMMKGFGERLREHGFTATILGIPACFEAVFAPGPITDYRGTMRSDPSIWRRLNELLLERGILKGETKYYLSIAHTDEDVRQTFDIWSDALEVLASERVRQS
jgi:glutamate-1-semialdehyde 2,1-aminomutase